LTLKKNYIILVWSGRSNLVGKILAFFKGSKLKISFLYIKTVNSPIFCFPKKLIFHNYNLIGLSVVLIGITGIFSHIWKLLSSFVLYEHVIGSILSSANILNYNCLPCK
jgi:hypothetical protein